MVYFNVLGCGWWLRGWRVGWSVPMGVRGLERAALAKDGCWAGTKDFRRPGQAPRGGDRVLTPPKDPKWPQQK